MTGIQSYSIQGNQIGNYPQAAIYKKLNRAIRIAHLTMLQSCYFLLRNHLKDRFSKTCPQLPFKCAPKERSMIKPPHQPS